MNQPRRSILSVVVLNFRTPGLVIDCLQSLQVEIESNDRYEVLVVDNYSGDDSADKIGAAIEENGWSPWARVVRASSNRGFAAGNNIGIRESDAEHVLLINSDTIVRPGAIQRLVETMRENEDIGLLGPRLEWEDGAYQISTFRQRTPITELISASCLGVLERVFPNHVVAREMHEFTTDIDWVSFACVLIRREVFERAGHLDEGFFMYFEDMAFSRSARKQGFLIGYQPDARVVHLRGGSSPVKEQTKQRKRRPAYFYAARAHYFRNTYGILGYLAANVSWSIGWVIGSLRGRHGGVEHQFRDNWNSGVFQPANAEGE